MFVLCRSCAEHSNPAPCQHNDDERKLSGTWASPEIMVAIENGYEVVDVYEIWQFDNTSDTLFSPYMNRTMADKVHASGYPDWCDSDQKKAQYIADYKNVEDVDLDPAKMKKNSAMRVCAKMKLNSLWGKMGQRADLCNMKLVKSDEEFWRIVLSNEIAVTDIQFFGERYAQITYKEHDEFCSPGFNTNIAIAVFTTAYARLHLWQFLKRLERRVLYFDTDSIIFVHRPLDNTVHRLVITWVSLQTNSTKVNTQSNTLVEDRRIMDTG